MRQLFEILPKIAESDSTLLIEGPSGTGKECFARAIHSLSRRRDKRFVAVNCGGNRKAAAEHLGIDPSTLFRKARALGILLPEVDGRSKVS